MQQEIKNLIDTVISDLGYSIYGNEIEVEETKDKSHGDFACNIAMKLAKPLARAPREIANEIIEKLNTIYHIPYTTYQIAGPGFINFTFSKKALIEFLKKISATDLTRQILKNKKYFIEFAHPNTHKAFHIGHLRNLSLGESLVRIFENEGATVFRANYQGDIGPHVAKCIWAINKEGIVKDLDTAQKRAEYLGKVYAIGGKAYENDEIAKAEITEINKAIYLGKDKKLIGLYQVTRQWSLDYFEIIYKKLGTHFDKLFFESEVFDLGKKIVEENLKKGIFEISQGAIVFPGEKYGLHTRVFVTKNSTATYEGKEIGLSVKEYELCPNMDKKVHIVANEQSGYFQVVFKVIEMLNPKLIGKQIHVDYGMVKLNTGKMSSRTGDVVTAEFLIDEAKAEIDKLIQGKENFTNKEIEEIKEKVAIGGIKFMMLQSSSKNDIVFDIQKAVRLDGDSGAYIQYAYARIKSILRRAENREPQGGPFGTERTEKKEIFKQFNNKDYDLIRKLLYFETAIKNSALNYSPHYICHYLLELTAEFSSWYAVNRVLDEEEDLKNARLYLLDTVSKVLKKGLYLLGIETLEKM